MRDASPEVETPQVFGALYLIKRKTGEVASYIALDTDHVTLGRERECDIRLYFGDVSKLHAEIVFDSDTGLAELAVHGNNGLIYTHVGGQGTKLVPPDAVSLGEGDTIQIRQKLFRFSYGDNTTNSYQSPAPKGSERERRRLSHRLSIVPQGKRFAPSPAKMRPLGMTPGRSGLSKEVEIEEEDELVFDELVDVAEGDEGDRVYLEKRDEDRPAINPFMTPQPKGKAPLRNTSAIPRTRTLTFALPTKTSYPRVATGEEPDNDSVSEEEEAEEVEDDAAGKELEQEEVAGLEVEDDLAPPQTPTPISIPLPPADEPSYSPMGGPRRPMVSPRSAYATPRGAGSDSLRRALLLRSARKAWEMSHPEGIENEIANGNIEVRRRRSAGRKTLSPPAVVPSDSNSSDEVSSDEDKENAPQQLQWVYENGQAEVSQLDDSDSDRETSFDIDNSIPGQHVLDFHTSPDPGSPSESEEVTSEDEEDDGDEHSDSEESTGRQSDELSLPGYESDESVEVGDISSDIDDEVDKSLVCQPGEIETKGPSPIIASRFYTPQPKRKEFGGARMSLAGMGGPVRWAEQPSPVSDLVPTGYRIPPTPSRLGKPVRVVYKSPATKHAAETGKEPEDQKAEVTIPVPAAVPATPIKTPTKTPSKAAGGLTPAQRTALATPLALPTAPSESFRDSVPRPTETPRRSSFLDAVRLSVQNGAKKSSVSFGMPETPSRPALGRAASVGSVRRRGAPTPKVDPIDEGDSESLPATPTAVLDHREAQDLALPTQSEAEPESTPRRTRRRSLPSPSLAGLRDLLKTPKVPKTPSMAGVRDLFKAPRKELSPPLDGVRQLMREPKHARTPSFAGMREMFRAQTVPQTPAMAGIKEMFAQPVVPPTPDLEGMADMFPAADEDHVESEGKDEDEESEEEETPAKPEEEDAEKSESSALTSPEKDTATPRTRSKVPTRPSSLSTRAVSASSRRTGPAQEEEQQAEKPAAMPTRARAAPKEEPPAPAPAPVPARKTRLRGKADAEDAPSAPSRRAVSAPVRRVTRSHTAEPEEDASPEPDPGPAPEENQSAPTRRSRRVLGEAEQPTKPAAKRKPSSTLAARKAAAESEVKDKEVKEKGRASTANKENSATPDPEGPAARKRMTKKPSASSLPVRVTRSRKA